MKFFIDTNVLIDWILNRSKFHLEAELFMSAIVNGVAEGFVSSHSLTDLFYITQNLKDFDNSNVKAISVKEALSLL